MPVRRCVVLPPEVLFGALTAAISALFWVLRQSWEAERKRLLAENDRLTKDRDMLRDALIEALKTASHATNLAEKVA